MATESAPTQKPKEATDKNRKHNLMLLNLNGFARAAARMSLEETTSLQQSFSVLVSPSVFLYGGSILKDVGYACLATFPSASDALRAGLKIESSVLRHNQKNPDRELDVKISINTDELVVAEQWDDGFRRIAHLVSRLEKHENIAEKSAAPPPPPIQPSPAPVLTVHLPAKSAQKPPKPAPVANGSSAPKAPPATRKSLPVKTPAAPRHRKEVSIFITCCILVFGAWFASDFKPDLLERFSPSAAKAAPEAIAEPVPDQAFPRHPKRKLEKPAVKDLRPGTWLAQEPGDASKAAPAGAVFENGKLLLQGIASDRNYAGVFRNVKVDLGEKPYLAVEVESCSGLWSLSLDVGSPPVEVMVKPNTNETGKWVFDLRRLTGMSGPQSLGINLSLSSGGPDAVAGRRAAFSRLELAAHPE